jgi:hypothetical protein
MPKYFWTNITYWTYNIADLIWQFQFGLKRVILLNEMELLTSLPGIAFRFTEHWKKKDL